MSINFKTISTLKKPASMTTCLLNFRPKSYTPNLFAKVATPPTTPSPDEKLHPALYERQVRYVDEGLWETKVDFLKDPAAKVQSPIKTHDSLDALSEAEFQRRYPNQDKLSASKKGKRKFQIAFSAMNRDDLHCKPRITDYNLRLALTLPWDDSILETKHIFSKNSPMNGQAYKRMVDGREETVTLSQAIACSNDREVAFSCNMRRVFTPDGTSIGYTGRVDSDVKVEEQAKFLFLSELKAGKMGIRSLLDGTYEFDYMVQSLLTTNLFMKKKTPLTPKSPERGFTDDEKVALEKLQARGFINVTDPVTGESYRVRFNPVMFSRQCNLFLQLETFLPPFMSGEGRAKEITREGINSLKEILALRNLTPEARSAFEELEKNVTASHLLPEEELLYISYLSQKSNIPVVWHCKSSTDRTSIPIAISAALKQWIELNLPIPTNLRDLLKDYRFKELFAANWMAGHQITRYARGGEGEVSGITLNPKNLGYALGRGMAQNPLIPRLLPQRYLKPYPIFKKIIGTAALLPLLAIALPFVMVAALLRTLAWVATGFKHSDLLGPVEFWLPFLPFTMLIRAHNLFPDTVLNYDSPQVDGRALISGGKNGGAEDNQ